MLRRRVRLGAVGLCLVSALVGCTGGDEEPLGLSTVTAEPTAEASPSPSPTPTPTSVLGRVVDMSDPELGIAFDDVPDLTGDEADVYNWLATFEQEYWRTLTTNEASPAFDVFASPEIQARIEEIAANNTADQSVWGGVYHVRITGITVTGDAAAGTICDDYGQVTLVEPNGPVALEDVGVGEPVLLEVTLARNTAGEGLWAIQTSTQAGTC